MPLIHVVDDDDSVRNALMRLLQSEGYETRAYCSGAEFLGAERPDAPGCVVLDLKLPGASGLEVHDELNRDRHALPVIFLSGCADVPASVRAMKAGAVDFLTKPVRSEMLMSAVADALERSRARCADAEQRHVVRERYAKLTPRERQVFALVVRGRLNKQIAAELAASVRTIKAHRAQVMDKMCVRSVADLVRAADRLN